MNLIKELFEGNQLAWTNFVYGRIPRTVVIILAASSLSVAGLIMQSVSRNKFISPSTAGTSNAAMLGVLIGYLFLGSQSLSVKFGFAFIFAMASSFVFIFLLNKIKFKNVIYVPLIGMMYGALISAIATFIAHQTNSLQILAGLNLATFSHITLLNSTLLLILIPAMIAAFIFSASFGVVALGEDFSKNLGVNYKFVMAIALIIISAISASTVVVVGPLPFVGLIIPNIVTVYYGDNIKKSIFDIALIGSIFVLLNDIISRLIIFPYEVAVGFTMGITGAIIFLILIFKKGKKI